MNKFQRRSAIIGTILGDSSLCGKQAKTIVTGHGPKQLDYLYHKKDLFESFCSAGTRVKQAQGMDHDFYRLWTTTHHRYTALYTLIYKAGKKEITPKLLEKFDEVGLAFLFMDDGCKEAFFDKKYQQKVLKSYKFSLNSFSKEEVELLSLWLFEKYSIESKVYLDRGIYPYLRISKKVSRDLFANLIDPFVIDSMKYKLYI